MCEITDHWIIGFYCQVLLTKGSHHKWFKPLLWPSLTADACSFSSISSRCCSCSLFVAASFLPEKQHTLFACVDPWLTPNMRMSATMVTMTHRFFSGSGFVYLDRFSRPIKWNTATELRYPWDPWWGSVGALEPQSLLNTICKWVKESFHDDHSS